MRLEASRALSKPRARRQVREMAEEEGGRGPFTTLQQDVSRYLTTILIGSTTTGELFFEMPHGLTCSHYSSEFTPRRTDVALGGETRAAVQSRLTSSGAVA